MRTPGRWLFLSIGLMGLACNDGSARFSAKVRGDAGATGGGPGSSAPEVDAEGAGGGGSGGPGPGSSPGEGGSPGASGSAGAGGAGGAPPGPAPVAGTGGTGGMGGMGGTPGPAGPPGPRPTMPDASAPPPDPGAASGGPFQMLVLSKALEYRHASITACQQLLTELGNTPDANLPPGALPGSRWTVTIAKEDLSDFTDDGLRPYAIVFFCNPTGTVFTAGGANGSTGKIAIQNYLTSGGAWAGVHSATDFENTQRWTWFQDQVNGGNFASHDADGTPNSIVWQAAAGPDHPVVRGIRSPWSCADEWYRLNRNPETLPGFIVLGKLASDQRPAVYVREIPGGGRSFYTIRGHASSVYAEPNFRRLIHQGVLWAVRRIK